MIEIKDKKGNSLFKTDLKPEDLTISFQGELQKITIFPLEDNKDNSPIVKLIDESLKDILYNYWWGEF